MELSQFGELSKESFEIVAELGAGASGTVYKARQVGLDRLVALKVLKQTDSVALARFHREAQILAQLKHRNICQCFHFGVEKGVPFMALELIEAPTLRSVMADKQLDWRQSSEIGIQICAGLLAAHEKGVIHRDIKPENIMLTTDGTVKILDFGMSCLDSAAAQKLTQAHVTLGTPPYMSPEQCIAGRLDARSDIYALGCLLFECVAGTPPFLGETISTVMFKHENMDPPPLADYASVPQGYESIIRKALSKDPNRRYQSARDLALALGDLLEDPGTSVPLPPRKSASSFSASKARRYLLLAALSGLVVCGFGLMFRPAFVAPESEQSGTGLLRGSRSTLRQVQRLWDEDTEKSKDQARSMLANVIFAEENNSHPDASFLFDAYRLAAVVSTDLIADETYFRKALALKREDPNMKETLRSLSLNLLDQGKPADEFLLRISSMVPGDRSNAGFAEAVFCLQDLKQGRLKEAETHGDKACELLADLPGQEDVYYMYCHTIGALMLLGTESAKKTADAQLSHLSKDQLKLVREFLCEQAALAKQPAAFVQSIDELLRIGHRAGLALDKSYRLALIATANGLSLAYPASQQEILLAVRKIAQNDEAIWPEVRAAYFLIDHKDVTAAERVIEECKRRFRKSNTWPFCYQGYLDKLYGVIRADHPDKLAELLPRYDANLVLLRKTYGSQSDEMAMALWERAHLNKDTHHLQAAWRDFDACEAILVSKKDYKGRLELGPIRTQKASVGALRH